MVFYLYIEEPELNLHPGMQRVFLEALKEFPQTQVFFTTHSNHFLDMSIEIEKDNISIFSFQKQIIEKGNEKNEKIKEAQFLIEQIKPFNENVLYQLGVRNSSVFLSNCTIWVEGITDRLYIKKYLELYIENENKKNYTENIHYAFVEYAGSNIVHWNFDEKSIIQETILAKSISNRIFLIADSDYNENGEILDSKQKRFEKLSKGLKQNFYLLKCREIENLLTPGILKKTLQNYKKDDSDISFKDFKYDDYKHKPIGEFIYKIVDKGEIKKLTSKKNRKSNR